MNVEILLEKVRAQEAELRALRSQPRKAGLADEASARRRSIESLTQLVRAMHQYLETNHTFPAYASFDKNGKALLSWRVHLLPYLNQDNLYRQFHLDEPWDSEHNKKLIGRLLYVYALAGQRDLAREGKTVYLAPRGEATMFPGHRAVGVVEVIDGTANTIFLVEGDEEGTVPWTKPDDLNYDATKPHRGLGQRWDGGFLALFVDGAVHFIPGNINNGVLRALFTRVGGENVEVPGPVSTADSSLHPLKPRQR
jgi:hypothetical protein